MSKIRLVLKKIAISAVISFLVFASISIALIFTQNLISTNELQASNSEGGLDFTTLTSAETTPIPPLLSYTARDGAKLDFRRYESAIPTDTYFVLLHGSGWHGQQFLSMASAIAQSGVANVITPNLRGHGVSPISRGDLAYIGQFEDDIDDLITVIKKDNSNAKIILGGHSSGGGLVVRYLGGPYGKTVDAAILLAPYLKYNAPTTRVNSGGWARPLTRRIIGLSMLNSIGITALNSLPVIQFNMPQKVLDGPLGNTATLNYSYRLNTAFAPRSDYEADLKAMTLPFLLLIGSEDEAFFADKYEAVISSQTASGTYITLPGLSHLQIAQNEKSSRAIIDWVKALK
ncbi:MAG: alpha/beta fold hydrolase [Sneathiella sp.]